MAMDSTEFAKLTKKSVGESSEESSATTTSEESADTTDNPSAEATQQSESNNPRRRKGRTPIKNLPPVTKRLSNNTEATAAPGTLFSAVVRFHGISLHGTLANFDV